MLRSKCALLAAAGLFCAAPLFAASILEGSNLNARPSDPGVVSFALSGSDTISGFINSSSDADMYRFTTVAGLFSATTVGTSGTLFDTQLFLFDSGGLGLLANDDCSLFTQRSCISTTLAAGTYFLAISAFDLDPVSFSGSFQFIFPNDTTGQVGPTGGGSPIFSWGHNSFNSLTGTYTIDITLTVPTPTPPPPTPPPTPAVPEPASLILLGSGLAAVLRRLRK